MPRKKKAAEQAESAPVETAATTAVAEPEPTRADVQADIRTDKPVERPAWIDGPPTPVNGRAITTEQPAHGKHWGPPYKSIFTCPEMGFELGEDRRYRQRVFKFTEKPGPEILAALKEHGFTYRSAEKSWTVTANPDTRKLTDELARQWAGPNYIQGIER
jgi:hypothetical protein